MRIEGEYMKNAIVGRVTLKDNGDWIFKTQRNELNSVVCSAIDEILIRCFNLPVSEDGNEYQITIEKII